MDWKRKVFASAMERLVNGIENPKIYKGRIANPTQQREVTGIAVGVDTHWGWWITNPDQLGSYQNPPRDYYPIKFNALGYFSIFLETLGGLGMWKIWDSGFNPASGEAG